MNEPNSRPALKPAEIMAMRERSAATLGRRLAEKAVEAAEAAQAMAEQSPEQPTPEPQAVRTVSERRRAQPRDVQSRQSSGGCGCSRRSG